MADRSLRVPSYRRHRPTGQAVVTLGGRDLYLGKWGSAVSRREYQRRIAEWLACQVAPPDAGGRPLTIEDLIAAYWKFAKRHYVKENRPTSEQHCLRNALRWVRKLYSHLPAAEFGPRALKAVREQMIQAAYCRSTINSDIGRIRRMFRWAAAEELLPVSVYQALATVDGLRAGRSGAKESVPVRPIDNGTVDATMAHLPPVVRDMVKFQRLTGCRPGEVCRMRPNDLDRTSEPWAYRPAEHKTQHHGRQRVIFIGPKARVILGPYLDRPAGAYLFSPAESEQRRLHDRHIQRVIPLHRGNCPGSSRKRRPKVSAGARYTSTSYRRAICRAVELANEARKKEANERGITFVSLTQWSPNQLRHAAATDIRRQFGLEAAQVTLGHSMADVTQIYAERDLSKAAAIMTQIG